jgi:hypothetical protein
MIQAMSATQYGDNLVSKVAVTGQTAGARTPAGAGSFLDAALKSTMGPTLRPAERVSGSLSPGIER